MPQILKASQAGGETDGRTEWALQVNVLLGMLTEEEPPCPGHVEIREGFLEEAMLNLKSQIHSHANEDLDRRKPSHIHQWAPSNLLVSG